MDATGIVIRIIKYASSMYGRAKSLKFPISSAFWFDSNGVLKLKVEEFELKSNSIIMLEFESKAR